ncbi:inositol monophosphatase family protein [Dactylosporangium siamense]|uniref:Phosphatase n=1 Tax=Dactylosporangium siamense TaxID=685454 RepID=A0A919PVK1_9ACTN|nr:inositol monophosphatase family protein [Dactylosporangium siamense]GIG49233.1 phosphatase [Dactylosporangium siamense]
MTNDDLELAIAAAEAGAAVVRSHFGTHLDRYSKGGGDFATVADIEAERAILDVLRTARPGDAVHGEESGRTGSADRTWLVDPLCGTLNYAAGAMLVSVNVALRTPTGTAVAVSVDPFAREVFWTSDGPAHLRANGNDTVLVPTPQSTLVDVNLDPPFPNGPAFHPARLLADPTFGERFRPRVVSTTLAVAWVAAGRRAAYVTDGNLRDSVHFTPGIALCEAAGCVVTGLRGQPVHTGAGGLVVAADQQTHAALIELIERQFTAV